MAGGDQEATNWEGTPEAPPPADDHASTRWEATPPPIAPAPAPGVLHPEKTRWEATRAEATPPPGLARSSDPEATTDDLDQPAPTLGAPGQVINPESDATSWPTPPKPASAPPPPEITRWDGTPPDDRAEWIRAMAPVFEGAAGAYHVRFYRGPSGWKFDLEHRPDPAEGPRHTLVARFGGAARSVAPRALIAAG